MLGLIIDLAAIIIGSLIGVAAKKTISDELSKNVLTAIGLCVFFIGIKGLFGDANPIVIMIAFVVGTMIGAGLDFDGKMDAFSNNLALKFSKLGNTKEKFNAALSFFLVSAIGAYTIAACFTAGMGDNTMLYAKAILDIVTAVTMAAGMGIGVALSVIPILIYQGILILFSGWLAPLLTESMVASLTCTGALITIALGTNLIGATKLKPINFLPAIVLAPIFQYLADVLM